MRKVCAFFASLFLAILPLFAQSGANSITFEGRVVNMQGIPIKDANVIGSKANAAVATNVDGLFSLKLPLDGDSVIVSKPGMSTFSIFITSHNQGVVVLGTDNCMWMSYREYVQKMEGTAKTYYEAGQKFFAGDSENAPDYMKAYACFRRSANMEHAQAAYQLGKMYDEGTGITQNYGAAISWYKKAIRCAEANTRLGVMYSEGIGVPQNNKTAAWYFQVAVEKGDSVVAYERLNQLLESGEVNQAELVDNNIYEVVEENAEFPGGDQECYTWLAKHVKYPAVAQEQGIQGRVIVEFVVNKDGSIVDVKVLRSPAPSLTQEAERVIKLMPKWKPAYQNNKAVRSRFKLPVIFRLS